LTTDLNWDGIVDVSDASLVDNNAFNFVGEVKPAGALYVNTTRLNYNYKEPAVTIVLTDPYMIGKNKLYKHNYD